MFFINKVRYFVTQVVKQWLIIDPVFDLAHVLENPFKSNGVESLLFFFLSSAFLTIQDTLITSETSEYNSHILSINLCIFTVYSYTYA